MDKSRKQRLWEIIFQADSKAGRTFDVFLLIAIFISILAVILESVDTINEEHRQLLRILEWVITIIFTAEYAVRIYVVRKPHRYIFSFYGIVDFLSILPSYLGLILLGSQSMLVIRALRLLRVFRILKISRYTKAGNTITSALKSSLVKISVFLFAIVMLVIIIGTMMYLIEGKDNGFNNIPTSIYWAIVTLTTVGYGDIAPHTVLGQLLASLVMIMGYGIIAVPTGIVTAQVMSEKYSNPMKSCPDCNDDNHPADAAFCKSCGSSLEKNK
ncbi:MAG: ion transporter [Bacteroidetes bacterium]|nr:ion transporter [Bacteroidota bacterium]MBT3750745.1 ion transporter [Bacteroidota bacterium]MBT4399030.1 ion transporter [Bacteroidota bacterium]MBT4409277.1 ion transporter [Bacteroidota bacterium]MBT5427154.1 ion transporter [Bacteroidota bacterium]